MVVLSWLLLTAGQALGADAQTRFVEGERAFSAGEYEKAARAFEAAYRESPHVSVLFNAAVSWDHAGEMARAAGAYYATLEQDGVSPEQAEEAESRLEALSRTLGFVQVSQPVGGMVSVRHIKHQSIPAHFFLSPGSYRVVLETPLGLTETPVRVHAGERLRLVLNEVQRPEVVAEPVAPAPAKRPTAPEPADSTQEVVGWVALGVGVLATGAAAYLGYSALNARDRFSKSGNTDAAARRDAASLRAATNATWAGAGVVGVAGAVLLLTAPTIEF